MSDEEFDNWTKEQSAKAEKKEQKKDAKLEKKASKKGAKKSIEARAKKILKGSKKLVKQARKALEKEKPEWFIEGKNGLIIDRDKIPMGEYLKALAKKKQELAMEQAKAEFKEEMRSTTAGERFMKRVTNLLYKPQEFDEDGNAKPRQMKNGVSQVVDLATATLKLKGDLLGVSGIGKILADAGVVDSFKENAKKFGEMFGIETLAGLETSKDKKKKEDDAEDKAHESRKSQIEFMVSEKTKAEIEGLTAKFEEYLKAQSKSDSSKSRTKKKPDDNGGGSGGSGSSGGGSSGSSGGGSSGGGSSSGGSGGSSGDDSGITSGGGSGKGGSAKKSGNADEEKKGGKPTGKGGKKEEVLTPEEIKAGKKKRAAHRRLVKEQEAAEKAKVKKQQQDDIAQMVEMSERRRKAQKLQEDIVDSGFTSGVQITANQQGLDRAKVQLRQAEYMEEQIGHIVAEWAEFEGNFELAKQKHKTWEDSRRVDGQLSAEDQEESTRRWTSDIVMRFGGKRDVFVEDLEKQLEKFKLQPSKPVRELKDARLVLKKLKEKVEKLRKTVKEFEELIKKESSSDDNQ